MSGRLMIALQGDTALSHDDKKRLRYSVVGGVILFARNFANSAQLRQLTAAIRAAAAHPLLIATDQEGGRVQRFAADGFTPIPPMATVATASNTATQAAGLVLAAELLAHGVELTFAPVLDIDHGNSDIIGSRAFAADPHTINARADTFINGLRQGGMVSCAKHFPGHGYASADSHNDLPTDSRPTTEMQACDWQPFAHFAANGGELLMTAHIVYPAVDPHNAATFSTIWLKDILRKKLNFRGLIVGDDLSMAGAKIGDVQTQIATAHEAGCDLWMVCNPAEVDAAIDATNNMPNDDGNLWASLSRAHAPRIGIGDAAYRQARAEILAIGG